MDSEENVTSCSACREINSDPRRIACGHSFCLKCLQQVAGNNETFPCPICRFDVDLTQTNVDQLLKNVVFCNVIEARDTKQPLMCLDHNKLLDLFCQGCDAVICSKCLTMHHKGHAIEDIEIIFIERNKQLGAFLESTKHLASMAQDKSDAVKQSRISMEKNIDSISKTVENTFKKWNDALQKQQNVIFSYLHQERDQKRQVFVEAERILAGSMTTVTGLDTEINKLRCKDTALVVQQYGSIKARQEDTERKVLQEIETCFTPSDNLVLEIYAPWIEEAINNIKHIDMKQTQARPGRQKIAEIQDENVILKRECEKLRITLQELEKRECEKFRNTLQELERETRRLQVENKYLKLILDDLHKSIIVGEATLQMELKPPEDIKNDKLLMKLTANTRKINLKYYELETELNYIHRTISQLTSMIVGDDRSNDPTQEKTNKFTATGRQPKRNPAMKFEQREQSSKIDNDIELVTSVWRNLKEKEIKLSGFEKSMEEKTKEYQQKHAKEEKSKAEIVAKLRKTEQALNDKSVTLKKLQAKHETLQIDHANVDREKSILEDKNRKIQYSISCLQQEKVDMDGKYQCMIEKQNDEITRLRQAEESLLTRLSEIAGDRFTHDNVKIADLSDPDRPTKQSETYSELYDIEWTDAFEELTENMELSDEAAIRFLLKILMNAFHKCKEITWDRYESLKLVASTLDVKQDKLSSMITEEKQICMQSTSLTSTLSIDQEKSLRNIWRATTIYLKDESLKLLCANLITCLGKPETEMPKTSKYLTCCTELCWKMGVQKKPMHLDLIAEKEIGQEKQFDTDKFRAYTKTGQSVAYVVWPALLLHEGGVMLAKGIAQGCQKRVSSKE